MFPPFIFATLFCFDFFTDFFFTLYLWDSLCSIFGGELAAVENAETQKFLQEQLSGRLNYSQPVWIGLTRATDNSTFAFPDGQFPCCTQPASQTDRHADRHTIHHFLSILFFLPKLLVYSCMRAHGHTYVIHSKTENNRHDLKQRN